MMIGIDIVKVERIEKLVAKYPQKALKRFLHEEEIVLAKTPQTIAGFYAAKEAVAKALGQGISASCGFLNIKIHKDIYGAPYFTLDKDIVKKYNIRECALSITHDGGFAIAVASILTENKPQRKICH
jgi:holo-[acyl-carrier protein] synthase